MDKREFANVMLALASNFNAELDKHLAGMWHRMLVQDGVTIEEFKAGVEKLFRTRTNYGMPNYAEIIEAIGGKPEDRALIIAHKILKAMKDFTSSKTLNIHYFGLDQPDFAGDQVATAVYNRLRAQFDASTKNDEKWLLRDIQKLYLALSKDAALGGQMIEAPADVKKLTAGIGKGV